MKLNTQYVIADTNPILATPRWTCWECRQANVCCLQSDIIGKSLIICGFCGAENDLSNWPEIKGPNGENGWDND
jgi:transcription elongation factor Elf1